ncbi:recQ-mediated genome instability protein 1 isoform X2 [Ricinus communis]|uniref:recQ-mediated genome instability protein 1 isoform X2 n=1 Tax=Ricinus communis TaxID=3988 RepID=UPI000772B3D7|nr:recQ-mediated genome instability protein 1 isoform X2 [Ricinus communis]|eukprot:XP_015580222.1 recQ-mediated genome instability protein 1 isoform X2 [Ricinus communis]
MPRRRLTLSSFSDEEEEHEHQQNPQQQRDHDNELHLKQHLPNPNPNLPAEPVTISDDDEEFIDVSDYLTPPSPPPEQSVPHPPVPPVSSYGCPIDDFLLRMGLKLRREWLDSCLGGLDSSVRGLDVAAKAKLCFQQFLFSDMNYSGGGLLPPNVDSMHCVNLAGPFVLQVDEIVNISSPLKGRYRDAPPGIKRCLKLSMTDGVQRVFGMEYRPIKDLQVLAPAGLKVVICNVHIRHGLLMLVPEALEVLGGIVDELEAARQRLVEEVNKPPRGRRSRSGVVPPLTSRATLAAWPSNGVSFPENTNSPTDGLDRSNGSATFVSHGNDSVCIHGHSNSSDNDRGPSNNSVNVHGHSNSSSNFHGNNNRSVNVPGQNNSSNVLGPINSSIFQGAAPLQVEDQGAGTSQRTPEEFAAPRSSVNTIPDPLSSVLHNVEEMHIDASFERENAVSYQHSNMISNHEDTRMADEFDHPLILSGDREIPFTYLASLSAKWAAMKEKISSVQGKCFLTGVKGFQYKQRTTYELRVYVDDGSLISEILVDHNVVQKGIGHSPEEVTAALSSSDAKRVGNMKDTLKQFQIFLVNFEGIIRIEMNRTSSIPIALEMNQGCPASDAWLLVRRLKSSPAVTPQRPSSDPIDISP